MLKRRRKNTGSKLRFERLEGRMMLSAAVVQVKLDHGTLKITGTNMDDTITVTQGPQANSFDVDTGGGPVTYFGVKNISIDAKGGNDAVTVGDITFTTPIRLAGDLVIEGGTGNDSIIVTTGVIGGNLRITGSAGDDIIQVGALTPGNGVPGVTVPGSPTFVPTLVVGREMVVEGGTGSDSILISEVQVGRNARVLGNAGFDFVSVGVSSFFSNLTVDTGDCNDVAIVAGVSVRGNCEVETGGGNDFVAITGLDVVKKLEVDTGAGNDELFAQLVADTDMSVADALTAFLTANQSGFANLLNTVGQGNPADGITAVVTEVQTLLTSVSALVPNSITAQNARFEFEAGNDDAIITDINIFNEMVVDLGAGNDNLIITAGTIGGNLRVSGGCGNDIIQLGQLALPVTTVPGLTVPNTPDFVPTLIVGRELVVEGGDGNVAIVIGETQVGRNARVTGGGGFDFVTIGASAFFANLIVDTGAGNDVATLAGVLVRGNCEVETEAGNDFVTITGLDVVKKLEVDTGAGNDQFFAELVTDPADTTIEDALTAFLTANALGFANLLGTIPLADLTANFQELITDVAGLVPNSITAQNASFEFEAGNDVATIMDTNIFNELVVYMGLGNDTLTFDGNTFRIAVLDGGAGVNQLFLGTNVGTIKKITDFNVTMI